MSKQHATRASIKQEPRQESIRHTPEERGDSVGGDTLTPSRVLQLQRLLGNRGVQQLLQRDTPQATSEQPSAQNQVIEIEEGMFIGGAAFHEKAQRGNQHYANNPPSPGWPYRQDFKAVWDAGSLEEFADRVAAFQYFVMKLDDKADGILGPITAAALVKRESSEANSTDSTNAATETSVPAETTETTSEGAQTTDTPAAPVTEIPAVAADLSNHPISARILTPLRQTFTAYKTAVSEYQSADRAVNRAKKDEKAEKQEVRAGEIEEMEAERAKLRTAVDNARDQIAALTAVEFGGSEQELKQMRAYLYREVNANTVFYAQGENANILHGNGHKAAGRTCNMTVIAMILEALGKSASDYNGGDISSLIPIAAEFGEALGVNNANPDQLTTLRLPDFMQLVALDIAGDRAKAADSITSHSFIITVAKKFGLKLTEVNKAGDIKDRAADADYFLGSKHTKMLDTLGAVYRPADSDARKALNDDETYKALKEKDKREQHASEVTGEYREKQRATYAENVEKWTEIDTAVRDSLVTLQSALTGEVTYETVLPTLDQTVTALKAQQEGDAKPFKGKVKQIAGILKRLEAARKKGDKSPAAGLKAVKGLFEDKGSVLKSVEASIKADEGLTQIYATLADSSGIETLLPLADYKSTIIPVMQAAINGGNQVMVNLHNHFVRLQSLDEDAIIIDDPGNRQGENVRVPWEQAREYGYFQNYLILAP